MISLDNVTVAYGGFVLLDGISFHISESDKIGLVGKNGAGKSTIMKLICEIQSPTSGNIDKPNHLTIGYLPQIMEHNYGRSVLEEAMSAFSVEREQEAEIEEITRELGERTDYESDSYLALAERLADLNDSLATAHSEPPEVQARRTLLGLGFREDELGRPTETFSQGWNMRIELAKILLRRPDLLLLDEPTNHLDIESIEWLEDYLASRKGSLMLVSIFQVSGTQGREDAATDCGLCQPAEDDREDRGFHRAFPLQGHQVQSGAVQDKGFGENRTH